MVFWRGAVWFLVAGLKFETEFGHQPASLQLLGKSMIRFAVAWLSRWIRKGCVVLWYSIVSYNGKILQQNMGTSTLALGGLGKSMINFAVTWCMQ